MDIDNIDYLDNLAANADFFHKIKNKSVDYILDNKLMDNQELCVTIVLVGALWAANQLDKEITRDELEVFFGIEAKEDDGTPNFLTLSPALSELTLNELHDSTVESFNTP